MVLSVRSGFLTVTTLAALCLAASSRAQVSFAPAVPYTVGANPSSIALGNLNQDGRPDMAVANSSSGTVSVFLNQGNGSFTATGSVSAGTRPSSVVIADFNGDGLGDLAVANAGSNNVTVFLGLGNGTFLPGVPYSTGSNPTLVVVGDFNHDGQPDLAVCNQNSDNVTVLLNAGGGVFSAPGWSPIPVGAMPYGLTVADLNGDGWDDLATADFSGGSVTLLFNQSGSGFRASTLKPSRVPTAVTAADLDGDGAKDLVSTDYSDNVALFLKGHNNGSFDAPSSTPDGGVNPTTVIAADFSGDGRPDLLIDNVGSSNVSLLTNNGGGSFSAPMLFANGSHNGVAAADLNGDGLADVVVTNFNGTVSVLMNQTSSISSLTFDVGTNPAVEQGRFAIGTIVVSTPAPAGGDVITVTSNNQSIAYIPPSVLVVPQGQKTTSFLVGGIAPGDVSISVSLNGTATSIPFHVNTAIPGGGGGSSLKGDMNGDNKLTIDDAQILLKIIGGMTLAG